MRPRRQYEDVVLDRVRGGDWAGLLDLGVRWVGSALARRARRPLVGPTLGTLLVTYRCNLRCRVCDLPYRALENRRRGIRDLDTRALRAVLRDMKAIGTAGVGVTGGEPMLRRDLEDLLAYATSLGLHAHLNTDGFDVERRARGLLGTGVRSVNVSLDGATAATHDAARGRAGAFDDACRALSVLARARGAARRPRLTAVTVLTSKNLTSLEDVARVALAAGADRVGVIPVHDFGQGEAPVAPADLARLSATLARLREAGALDNSPSYLDLVPAALRGTPSPLDCYAPYTSVVVDCYGDVFACFPRMETRQPVGRVPLARLWRSAAYARARDALHDCRACLWNCHTEMNLILPQGAHRATRTA